MDAEAKELLTRLDERVGHIQDDVTGIKTDLGLLRQVRQANHDAALTLEGEFRNEVTRLDGRITNSKIILGITNAIGTAFGIVFGIKEQS